METNINLNWISYEKIMQINVYIKYKLLKILFNSAYYVFSIYYTPLNSNSHTWKEVDLLFGFWSWREEQGLSTEGELFWILTVLLPIGVEWGAFHSNWCMRIISLGLSFGMKNVTIVPILPETRLTGTCDKYKKVFLVILQPYK